MKGIGGHQRAYRGQKDEWLTPPDLLKALGDFDLDPCAPVTRPWDIAKHHLTIENDGLLQEWHGKCFVNPPYGPETGKWLNKLAKHGNGIALTFARTETRMFFEFVWNLADSLLFIEGRLYFYSVDGKKAKSNSGGPSVLIAYGQDNCEILKKCGIPGKYIPLV